MFKFLYIFLLFFSAFSLKADYIYWRVDFAAEENLNYPWKESDGDTPYVWLVALNNETGERQTLMGEEYDINTGEMKTNQDHFQLYGTHSDDKPGIYMAMNIASGLLGNNSSTYSFFVEMGNYINGVEDARYESVRLSYGDLKTHIGDSTTFEFLDPWNPALTGFTQIIPEPNSFLLFIFGIGFLSLKRKKSV